MQFDALDRFDREKNKIAKTPDGDGHHLKKIKNYHNYVGRNWSGLVEIWHSEAV